jgi:hypothetical protein
MTELCEAIAGFVADPDQVPDALPPTALAQAWLEHATSCDQCAESLAAVPAAAMTLIERGRADDDDDDDEDAAEIGLLHAEMFALGRMVSARLSRDICGRLSQVGGLEPLRHELRLAADTASATPAEIRAAIAVAEVCLAFEGLAFQSSDEGVMHKIHVRADGHQLSAGEIGVPEEYVPMRIADAISCSVGDSAAIFQAILELVRDSVITLPDFQPIIGGDRLVFVHESDPDKVELMTSIAFDANTSAEYVFVVEAPGSHAALEDALQQFPAPDWTMRPAVFGAVLWRPD